MCCINFCVDINSRGRIKSIVYKCTCIKCFLGNASSINPPIWRFLPGMDPMVDTLLVRDLDSIISSREAHAVNMFLASSKVSRNNHAHCVFPNLVS